MLAIVLTAHLQPLFCYINVLYFYLMKPAAPAATPAKPATAAKVTGSIKNIF